MAGGIVTVLGAAGHIIPVTVNGSQAYSLAQSYAAAVNSAGSSGSLYAVESSGPTVPAAAGFSVTEFVATAGGYYTYPSGYNHFTTETTDFVTIVASAAAAGSTLNTLVGTGGATYIAGNESGTFIAGGGNNLFLNSGPGAYTIATSNGNDSIFAGSGNTSVAAGLGHNLIVLGSGSDTVTSTGTDQIVAGLGSDTISITGVGTRVEGSTGFLTVTDQGVATSITGAAGTNLIDGSHGSQGSYVLDGVSTVYAGSATSVTDTGSGTLTFIGATNASATVDSGSAAATVFGAYGSNISYSGHGTFTSAGGNETLNGAGSDQGFAGFVTNQLAAGGNTSLIGGGGSDTLVAGLGNQTITGGAGANVFVLAANGTEGEANITISDLGSSASNLVALYGYGANEVANALSTQTVQGGNSTITLGDKSTVTFLGVTDLKPTSFVGDK